jgi:hypothetical protein
MVQIIPNNQRRSFGEQLLAGVNESIPGIKQHLDNQNQMKQMQQQMQQENETAKQMGFDLSGITDPKTRQQMFGLAMQGANQQGLEMLKQQGKQQQIGQKQDFLSNLFGGGQEQQVPQEMQGQPTQDTMHQGFDPIKLSDADIAQATAMDPNLGRILQQQKDVALREKRSEREFSEKQKKDSPEYQRQEILTKQQATDDAKFYRDLNERKSKQILKKDSLQRLKAINKKGVSGKVYEKVLDSMGLTAKTSEGRRELSAEVKNQFTDFKAIAGSQLSASEFFVLAGAYPNSDFSQEANEAIINNLEQIHDTLDKEEEIARRLKKENGGKIPENSQEKVNKELQAYVSNRIEKMKDNIKKIQNAEYGIPEGFNLMFDNEGQPLSVPDSDVAKLLDDGIANLP